MRPLRRSSSRLYPNSIVLTGAAGSYASTPDSAALDITGDIDIRLRVAADSWTPAATQYLFGKHTGTGNQRSCWAYIRSDGKLAFEWSADGAPATANTSTFSTVATGFSAGTAHHIRITLDVNNGSGGADVKFYTSDNGVTWTQLGATVTEVATTSLFSGTADVLLGALESGGTNRLTGRIYEFEIYNGIDGTLAARFDPLLDAKKQSQKSFVSSSTGETWTINSPAYLK